MKTIHPFIPTPGEILLGIVLAGLIVVSLIFIK